MKVEFEDDVSADIVELISELPALFQEIKPAGLNRFDGITLSISNSNNYQCEIVFGSYIRLSQKTIEIIWSLNFAHLYYYDFFCKGIMPEGQLLKLESPGWDLVKPQLSWAVNNLNGQPSDYLKTFTRNFFRNNSYGIIFSYTLIYFIAHELFHTIHSDSFDELILEEKQCDYDATNFIINAQVDKEYIERSKGVALGLMMLNVYGIHSSNYDGKNHPFTYDRLIENLSLCFGKDNDKIWGFVVAMFALHLTNQNFEQPINEHENFFECMLSYKKILELNQAIK